MNKLATCVASITATNPKCCTWKTSPKKLKKLEKHMLNEDRGVS